MMKKISVVLLIFCIVLFSEVMAFPASSSVIYNGIDVSEWQGNINWEEVKSNGIEIAYIRATEGNSYKDPDMLNNYYNAKKNGIKVGFYHYLTAKSEAEAIEQANFFVSNLKGLEIDCRLAMDFEDFENLNVDGINEIARSFLEEVENISGKEVIIYSDAYNAGNVFSSELAEIYPIWVADYDVAEPMDGNWKVWDGFQYTDYGIIQGIDGYVDKDYFTSGVLLSNISTIPENTDKEDSENITKIIVQKGQTLSEIAEKYNTSYMYLAKINNISNPNLIYIGQIIQVPQIDNAEIHDTNHRLYIVKRYDTLWEISREFGVSIEEIVKLNNIANPNLIYVGQILRIPNN